MSDFRDVIHYLLTDRRTKWQKIKDRMLLFFYILFVIGIFVGIGILIGKYLL